MMEKEKINIWSLVLNFILGTLLVVSLIFLFRSCNTSPEVIQIVQKDTITITKDSIVERIKWRTHYDTVFVDTIIHDTDTFEIRDTLHIPIDYKEASFKTSKDSIDIEAKIQYHGFQAEIDTIQIGYNFHWTEEVKKKKKIGWAITIGPSINLGLNYNILNKNFDCGPGIGVSVVVGPSFIIK